MRSRRCVLYTLHCSGSRLLDVAERRANAKGGSHANLESIIEASPQPCTRLASFGASRTMIPCTGHGGISSLGPPLFCIGRYAYANRWRVRAEGPYAVARLDLPVGLGVARWPLPALLSDQHQHPQAVELDASIFIA